MQVNTVLKIFIGAVVALENDISFSKPNVFTLAHMR